MGYRNEVLGGYGTTSDLVCMRRDDILPAGWGEGFRLESRALQGRASLVLHATVTSFYRFSLSSDNKEGPFRTSADIDGLEETHGCFCWGIDPGCHVRSGKVFE